MAQNRIFLPGLNGIRAIATMAVVFSHIGLAFEFGGLQNKGEYALASYGVTVFVGLSGFLITYLIITEREKTKTVAIRKFYFRRILNGDVHYWYSIQNISGRTFFPLSEVSRLRCRIEKTNTLIYSETEQ